MKTSVVQAVYLVATSVRERSQELLHLKSFLKDRLYLNKQKDKD